MKVSEWLAKLDSHTIYDAQETADDFKKETGLEPCWHVHSAREIIGMIKARGLGGSFHGEEPAISGYEVAEALAETLAKSESHRKFHGRGSRFDAALMALQQANM